MLPMLLQCYVKQGIYFDSKRLLCIEVYNSKIVTKRCYGEVIKLIGEDKLYHDNLENYYYFDEVGFKITLTSSNNKLFINNNGKITILYFVASNEE
jgi:hypothetical protein